LTSGNNLTATRIAGWFGASNTNYGIGIAMTGSTSGRQWHSSSASTAGYRPKLVIGYTTAGDLEINVFDCPNLETTLI
jgi:hypothetical protein